MIVGAGMVGCELAEDLVRAGHAVTLLDRLTGPLAGVLPVQASDRLRQRLMAIGVRCPGPVAVQEVSRLATGRLRIVTQCGQTIDADELVAATGLATESRLARSAGLAFDRGIVVDRHTLRTSVPDIYALGDCISIDGAPCRFIEPITFQADIIARDLLGQAASGIRTSRTGDPAEDTLHAARAARHPASGRRVASHPGRPGASCDGAMAERRT